MKKNIRPDENMIAKIEGHGSLKIDFDKKRTQLSILEGERLFEGMLLGRPFEQTYWITPRICGVCPIVHSLASVKAVEDAFKINVSYSTQWLRSLIVCAQMLGSHILHLVFLSLPDYLGVDRGTEIKDKHPKYFNMAFKIKQVSDKTAEIIGGRAVHPVTVTAGGFFKLPTLGQIKEIKSQLQSIVDDAEGLVNLTLSLDYPQIRNSCEYLSARPLNEEEYPIYNFSEIASSRGLDFKAKNYDKEIKEKVISHSTAKFSTRRGQGFMVGALARMVLFKNQLSPLAQDYLDKISVEKIKFNPFYNNLAQAIEVLDYTEKGINLCDQILKNGLDKPRVGFKPRAGRGIGVMEAPRGTLYHDYTFDSKGRVTNCNIVTPTVQNLTHIEEDANALLQVCDLGKRSQCYDRVEMLIRAYDPCITCSVH
jgi:coenzyme F420-reducing hydrogenase alpha subunit